MNSRLSLPGDCAGKLWRLFSYYGSNVSSLDRSFSFDEVPAKSVAKLLRDYDLVGAVEDSSLCSPRSKLLEEKVSRIYSKLNATVKTIRFHSILELEFYKHSVCRNFSFLFKFNVSKYLHYDVENR